MAFNNSNNKNYFVFNKLGFGYILSSLLPSCLPTDELQAQFLDVNA